MIKGITIENFKGIGDAPGVHLDLKPVTMLFGSNSAGKSTIFHALLYAYEVLVNRNLNPDRTTIGGEAVDLGGFETFIHRRELHRGVTMEFDLDMSNEQLDNEWPTEELLVGGDNQSDISSLGVDVWTAKVRFHVHWDFEEQKPFISEYAVTLNDEPVGRITYDATSNSCQLEDLNLYHSVFAWPDEVEPGDEECVSVADFLYPHLRSVFEDCYFLNSHPTSLEEVKSEQYARVYERPSDDATSRLSFRAEPIKSGELSYTVVFQRDEAGQISVRQVCFRKPVRGELNEVEAEREANLWLYPEDRNTRPQIKLRAWGDALPAWNRPLPFDLVPEKLQDDSDRTGEDVRRYQMALVDLLTRLIVIPGKVLARELQLSRYIGPLREIPARNHRAPLTTDNSRWASGLAAWDTLFNADDATIQRASDWLSREDRLGTGYSIQVKRFRELDSDGFIIRSLLGESHIDAIEMIRESIDRTPEQKRIFLRDEGTLVEVEPQDIAVGITQLVPIVVAAVDNHGGLSLMEQPELHNHPAVEVGLGDLFIDAIKNNDDTGRFILETHGEHLILRMLRRIRQTTDGELPEGHRGLRPDDIAVYHVKRVPDGVEVVRLRIDETGEFIDKCPKGFFEERAEELF